MSVRSLEKRGEEEERGGEGRREGGGEGKGRRKGGGKGEEVAKEREGGGEGEEMYVWSPVLVVQLVLLCIIYAITHARAHDRTTIDCNGGLQSMILLK